jgi:hypothetical protein
MAWLASIDLHAMAEALTFAVTLLVFPLAIGGIYMIPKLAKTEITKVIERKIGARVDAS